MKSLCEGSSDKKDELAEEIGVTFLEGIVLGRMKMQEAKTEVGVVRGMSLETVTPKSGVDP